MRSIAMPSAGISAPTVENASMRYCGIATSACVANSPAVTDEQESGDTVQNEREDTGRNPVHRTDADKVAFLDVFVSLMHPDAVKRHIGLPCQDA